MARDSRFHQHFGRHRAGSESTDRSGRRLIDLPELVTANQGEDGILDLCDLLLGRGIGIEAGLLSLENAQAFVAAGIAPHCVRAMIELLDPDPDDATSFSRSGHRGRPLTREWGVGLEQVHHHGTGSPPGQLIVEPYPRGHGIRTGLRGHTGAAGRAPSSRQRRPGRSRCGSSAVCLNGVNQALEAHNVPRQPAMSVADGQPSASAAAIIAAGGWTNARKSLPRSRCRKFSQRRSALLNRFLGGWENTRSRLAWLAAVESNR